MAFKVFIDANILLDFTLKRPGYDIARKIFELIVSGQMQAFITPSIIHILGYWLTKAYGNAKAKELILTLLTDIYVIDASHTITLNALHSKIKDVEDAIQYYTAMHYKIDYFITRDKDFKKESIPTLPVYTPEEFLKEVE